MSSNVLAGTNGYAIRLRTRKSQLNKNRDRDLADGEREAVFAGAGDKQRVFDNCMKARGQLVGALVTAGRLPAGDRSLTQTRPGRPRNRLF